MNENVGAPETLVPVDTYFQWLHDKQRLIKKENDMTLQSELKEYLANKGCRVGTVARRGKVAPQSVRRALLGEAITPATANAIMRVIGKVGLIYTRSKHNVTKKCRRYHHRNKKGNGIIKTYAVQAPFGLKYTTVRISGGRSLLVNTTTGKTQLLEV